MCSIVREPRREECTICSATAPEDVLTVRMWATTPQPTAPASAQIRPARAANRRSQAYARPELTPVN
jgi:hypothetical protein